jgi:hypothetical protein
MADSKISALPASTVPLAGTEVLPIVQSSTTKQVSVANLTAGRAISATQLTLTTGNVIVANGQGIDFSATPNTGTSELFDDYEEGTWTPDQGSGLTVVGAFSSAGYYTKIGNTVHVWGYVLGNTSIAATASGVICTTVPFAGSDAQILWAGSTINWAANSGGSCGLTGANTSIYTSVAITASSRISFAITYRV